MESFRHHTRIALGSKLSTALLISAAMCHGWCSDAVAGLHVGASAVNITPQFEGRPQPIDGARLTYRKGDPFYDSGVDGLFDFEEPGALGHDAQPGQAGVDDDGNGLIDDCDRSQCKEYLAAGSDDVRDPNGDNYHRRRNRKGTEGDRKYQFLHLGGFSPYYPILIQGARLATRVHDPIWARAIAISRTGQGQPSAPVVIMSTDLPGLAWKHINPVRRRLSQEFDIPVGNIVISSTHNHAGPDAMGYWVTLLKNHNRAYTDRLRQWMYEAGRDAVRSMRPALMKTVTTTHVACVDARTGELKRDPDCLIPKNSYEYHLPDGGQWDIQAMQHDKRDPIVRNTRIVAAQFVESADDAGNGRTIATFVNWHNHPDSLTGDNLQVSSDFVHYIRQYIEQKLGGTAVYFSGTVGCQIGSSPGVPVPLWTEDMQPVYEESGRRRLVYEGWERIRSMGFEVGHEVVTALASSTAIDDGPVTAHTEPVDVRIDGFLHKLGTRSVWEFDVEQPDQLKRYVGGCLGKFGCVRSDLSILHLGDLGIVTAPGEIDPSYLLGRERSTADYGKYGRWIFPAMPAWDRSMPGIHHAVLGQANNYLSYMIHRADNVGWWNFKHPNHYEDFVTVSRTWGDKVGNQMMRMLGSRDRFYP